MSALKNQLRLILPSLSKEANANQNKEVKRFLLPTSFKFKSPLDFEGAFL